MTKRTSDNDILASVHKTATGLHEIGLIDEAKMLEFDALCLSSMKSPQCPAPCPASAAFLADTKKQSGTTQKARIPKYVNTFA